MIDLCDCVCGCDGVCAAHSSPQTLMTGSNPMLGCSPGTLAPGINLSGILPSGGLMSGTLPAMQPAAPTGTPFFILTCVF